MKITLVSGFLNKHLLPLCLELKKANEFYFIATENFVNPHIGSSYNREVLKYDFVINHFEEAEKSKAVDVVLTSDVVIFGGSSLELLELRKAQNKLSFLYTERFFKRGQWHRFIPMTRRILTRKFGGNNQNLYVLCASSYAVCDIGVLGFDTSRCFKFGYFPHVNLQDLSHLLEKKKHAVPKLLYAGRFIDWKRIEDLIKCCRLLDKNGIEFEANIIGDGPERKRLERLAKKYKLDNVHFRGAMAQSGVFRYMEESNIAYITSNYFEGWGAVVNESLAHGCPVIGSGACGSVAYLIKGGVNGYIYRLGDIKELYDKTLLLMKREDLRLCYINAYNTIKEEWNAEVAVTRFLQIARDLLENQSPTVYEDGPMSKA